MPMTPKQMIKLLKKNGFTKTRQRGSHTIMYNANKNITLPVPTHTKDLGKGLESEILKQAGLK